MRVLADHGIPTGVAMMPILPFIEDNEENVTSIVLRAHACGATFIVPWFGMSLRDRQRAYYYDQQFGTGFFRYGLSDEMTGEAHVQADAQVRMGGLSLAMVTPLGFFGIQGAVSQSLSGVGYAANLNYDVVNFGGLMSQMTGEHESLRLGAEYRSPEFRTPGDFLPVVTTANLTLGPSIGVIKSPILPISPKPASRATSGQTTR